MLTPITSPRSEGWLDRLRVELTSLFMPWSDASRRPRGRRPLPVFGLASVSCVALGVLGWEAIQTSQPEYLQGFVGGAVLMMLLSVTLLPTYVTARAAIQRHERAIGLAWLGMGVVVLVVGGMLLVLALDVVAFGFMSLLGIRS